MFFSPLRKKNKTAASGLQCIIFYRELQESHRVQDLQVVLEIRLVLGYLGNQDFLFLLVDLACLYLEYRGLLLLPSIQETLHQEMKNSVWSYSVTFSLMHRPQTVLKI